MLSHKQNLLEMLTICSEVVIKYLEEREWVPGVGRLLREHLQGGGGGEGGGQEARCGNSGDSSGDFEDEVEHLVHVDAEEGPEYLAVLHQ